MRTFIQYLAENVQEPVATTGQDCGNIASRVGLQNVKLLGKSRLDKKGKTLVKYEGDHGEGARIPGWIPIEYLTDEERELHQQMSSSDEPIPYVSQHEKNLKLYGKRE